jgi:hypothetical protein
MPTFPVRPVQEARQQQQQQQQQQQHKMLLERMRMAVMTSLLGLAASAGAAQPQAGLVAGVPAAAA